jgi:hypothetical protein
MRKSILILVLSFVLLLTFGINVYAQNKEVSATSTTTWYATSKILPIGEGIFYMTYEGIGVNITDKADSLFQNATARTLGAMKIEKGIYKDDQGWGVFNLQNGDKVFFTYKMAGEAKPGGIGSGNVTFTGGTGKAAGIQGGAEVTRTVLRSVVEGVGQNYTKSKIRYTLP